MEVAPEGRNVGPACPCKRVVNEEVVQDRAPDLNTFLYVLRLTVVLQRGVGVLELH